MNNYDLTKLIYVWELIMVLKIEYKRDFYVYIYDIGNTDKKDLII